MELISEGAEAKIFRKNKHVIKDRIQKEYRIKEIDSFLRKSRTKAEARLLKRARINRIHVPNLLKSSDTKLCIEFINGEKVSDYLKNNGPRIFRKIGKEVNKMHENHIVHGDLTTSNMILKRGKVYIIDFGLGEYSKKVEDKAVDLHVLKECLKSKHFKIRNRAWRNFLKTYKQDDVLLRLEKVEKRGKYWGQIVKKRPFLLSHLLRSL